MGDALGLHPGVVFRPPPSRIRIAAGIDEFGKGRVGHVVALDRKRRHVHGIARMLVVPAKRYSVPIDSERRATGVYVNPVR